MLVLSLLAPAFATVTEIVPYNDDHKSADQATLVVLLECTELPNAPKTKYDYVILPTFAKETDALKDTLVRRHIGDRVIRVTNPTQAELDALLPTLSAPNNGLWGTAVLTIAAPSFGADLGLETLMCAGFNPADTGSPDGVVPFEGTLLNVSGLKQTMYEVSSQSMAFLDDSPDMSVLVDLPSGVATKGMSADDWSDQNGFAVSAAGPKKNAKPGLLLALANVLEATMERDLTVGDLRSLLPDAARKIDTTASIITYANATGSYQDVTRVAFPGYTPPAVVKTPTTKPKKSKVVPIASFAAAGACAVGGGVLALQANAMYETAMEHPEEYEGMVYADLESQFNGYKYGAYALVGCTALGAGLGVTVLLTDNAHLSFGASPLGLNLTGAW